MDAYPSNSKKSKEQKPEAAPEKRVTPLTALSGMKPKKQGFFSSLLANDIPSMLRYVRDDVLLPSIRRMLHDVITNGADTIFFGEDAAKRSVSSNTSYFSYGSCFSGKSQASGSYFSSPQNKSPKYSDVVFPTRGLAEAALDQLWGAINRYGVARVGDLYDCAGITPPFTSYNYGWTDISSAKPVRNMDGSYSLKMPTAMAIED